MYDRREISLLEGPGCIVLFVILGDPLCALKLGLLAVVVLFCVPWQCPGSRRHVFAKGQTENLMGGELPKSVQNGPK